MLASLTYSLRRMAKIGGIAAGSLVAAGIVWALVQGRPVLHAVAVFLYLGAGALALLAVGGGGGGQGRAMHYKMSTTRAHQQRMNAQMGDNVWFLLLAVVLAGLGIVVQQVL